MINWITILSFAAIISGPLNMYSISVDTHIEDQRAAQRQIDKQKVGDKINDPKKLDQQLLDKQLNQKRNDSRYYQKMDDDKRYQRMQDDKRYYNR
ncbi:MAG: hypothetical protein H0U49_04505 [Parachlamydiaceae bacterium]|nr:hypothetical protein [Parachlamydiaceae bacterium]